MMKRIIHTTAAILLGLGLVSTPAFSQRVAERQKNQQKRIKEGVKNEELTKKEAVKLEAKEAKLHRQIQRDRADGPGLTPKERAKIERKQDKLSREIYKEKHDNQKQK